MEQKKTFTAQSLVIALLGNTVLLVILFLLLGEAIATTGAASFFGIGLLGTLGVWFLVRQAGVKAIEQAAQSAPAVAAPQPAPQLEPRPAPTPEPKTVTPTHPPEAAAVQLLAILQRQGRLIDFLQEDLRAYDDAQIGAAVRNVHEGCRQALADHVVLEPIFDQPEGSSVTVAPGFDAHAIRLTGNVVGDPPFKGSLRHRGWRVKHFDLPALMLGQNHEKVVAPAEVEV